MQLLCPMEEVAIGNLVACANRFCCECLLLVLLLREGVSSAVEDGMPS